MKKHKYFAGTKDAEWETNHIIEAFEIIESSPYIFQLKKFNTKIRIGDCCHDLQKYSEKYGPPKYECRFGNGGEWSYGQNIYEAVLNAKQKFEKKL